MSLFTSSTKPSAKRGCICQPGTRPARVTRRKPATRVCKVTQPRTNRDSYGRCARMTAYSSTTFSNSRIFGAFGPQFGSFERVLRWLPQEKINLHGVSPCGQPGDQGCRGALYWRRVRPQAPREFSSQARQRLRSICLQPDPPLLGTAEAAFVCQYRARSGVSSSFRSGLRGRPTHQARAVAIPCSENLG